MATTRKPRMNRGLYHVLRTIQLSTQYELKQFVISHEEKNSFRCYDNNEKGTLFSSLFVVAICETLSPEITASVRVDSEGIPYLFVYCS